MSKYVKTGSYHLPPYFSGVRNSHKFFQITRFWIPDNLRISFTHLDWTTWISFKNHQIRGEKFSTSGFDNLTFLGIPDDCMDKGLADKIAQISTKNLSQLTKPKQLVKRSFKNHAKLIQIETTQIGCIFLKFPRKGRFLG